MVEFSELRELFHKILNKVNGIHVVSYTFSYYLEHLDNDEDTYKKLNKEIPDTLAVIENYCNSTKESFATLCSKLDNLPMSDDCTKVIKEINKRLEDIYTHLKDADSIAEGIAKENFKDGFLRLQEVLKKFEPKCQYFGELIMRLKGYIIPHSHNKDKKT